MTVNSDDFSYFVHYDTLLHNVTDIYYKMRQLFYYKIQQLLENMTILLKKASVSVICDVCHKMGWYTLQ